MSETLAMDQPTLGAEFARLHAGPQALVVPNPWDAGSARLMAQLGFRALATTSGGLAFSLGLPDGSGALTREQVLENLSAIVRATPLPVTADLESGYGDKPEDVAESVRLAAAAGAVGASIEDTTGDPADPIRPLEEALERAEAAVAAARALPFPFTLTLRADNFFAGRPDLEDTLCRIEAFAAAGADVLYAPGIREVSAVQAILRAAQRPVNVLAVPVLGFTVAELSALGVSRVSVGSAMARSAYAAALTAGTELIDQGSVSFVSSIPTYADLNTRMSAEKP